MSNLYAKNNRKMLIVTLLMAFVILGIVFCVVIINKDNNRAFGGKAKVKEVPSVSVSPIGTIKSSETEDFEVLPSLAPTKEPIVISNEKSEEDDGLHTKVILRDGTEIWQLISAQVPVNTVNTSALNEKNGRKVYLSEGKVVSSFGVFVSEQQKYVNYAKLRKDNVNFVMVRLGYSGYESGQVQLDDYFADNCQGALRNNVKVGIYFDSHAITVSEAKDEAEHVIHELESMTVTYPVAIHLSYVEGDETRDENINKEDRTQIVKAFLSEIEKAGYIGAVYADKEWLVTKLNLSQLGDYDILLDEEAEVFDFPYRMHGWMYGSTDISGIDGSVKAMITFVNYSEK